MKLLVLTLALTSPTAALAQSGWGQKSIEIVEVGVVPAAFLGIWGTSRENCTGMDDVGPLNIKGDGFSHYEMSTDQVAAKKTGDRRLQITYSVMDLSSEELSLEKETWEISPDQNSLLVISENMPTIFSRCPVLAR